MFKVSQELEVEGPAEKTLVIGKKPERAIIIVRQCYVRDN